MILLKSCNIIDSLEAETFNDIETIKYFGNDFWFLMNGSCGDLDSTMEAICFIDYILNENKCKSICDVMCGNARHILGLYQLDYDVSGIDIHNEILESVRQSSIYDNKIKLISADIREYCFVKKYDCITLLTSSIGYYGKNIDIKIFQLIYKYLNTDGVIIIDIPNTNELLKSVKNRDWCKVESVYYLFSSKISLDNVKYTSMAVIDNTTERKYFLKMQLYTANELCNILSEIGFENIRIYYDFNLHLTEENQSRRIQIVAKKLRL